MFQQDPSALGSILQGFIDRMNLQPRIDAAQAVEGWAVVAGPRICAVTESVRLQGDVLHVKLTSAVWRHQLHLQREGWRTRLNDHLGVPIVREIVFR